MKRYGWHILLGIITAVFLWFSVTFIYKFIIFSRLDAETVVTTINWSVKEISGDQYLLEGHYAYHVNGSQYSGNSLIENPFYRNPWAAKHAIKEQASEPLTVYYSSQNPSYSALQKSFPLKEGLSSLVLCGLLAYFIGLSYYINGYKF